MRHFCLLLPAVVLANHNGGCRRSEEIPDSPPWTKEHEEYEQSKERILGLPILYDRELFSCEKIRNFILYTNVVKFTSFHTTKNHPIET